MRPGIDAKWGAGPFVESEIQNRGLIEGAPSVQTTITARHGQLSEGTKAKITAKLDKLLRYFDRLMSIEVTVDLEHKDSPTVDLKVSAEHKHDFVAEGQAGELLAAVDAAVHKIEQQIKRYKEKVIDQHHRGAGSRDQVGRNPGMQPEESANP
jgi:putative sigma-54 modulation protein